MSAQKSTNVAYNPLMKIIHWVMAIQIIALLAIGFYMSDMPWGEGKKTLMMLHKSCGAVCCLFILMRMFLRFKHPVPQAVGPVVLQVMSKLAAIFLYAGMIAIAYSGLFMSDLGGHTVSLFNLFDLPHFFAKNVDVAKKLHAIHVFVAVPFAVAIVLHVMAAVYHRFVLRDDVMGRMLARR